MEGWTGDPEFTAFVAGSTARLVRLGTLLTGNRHDGEDAVQEAMISVGQAWHRVRRETAFAYASRAVARKAIDIARARREVLAGEIPDRPMDDLGLLRHEEDRAFFARLAAVPAQQRAVLVLRYYADFDDRQIARVLRCSTSTVRSQAARALARLRDEAQPDGRPERTGRIS